MAKIHHPPEARAKFKWKWPINAYGVRRNYWLSERANAHDQRQYSIENNWRQREHTPTLKCFDLYFNNNILMKIARVTKNQSWNCVLRHVCVCVCARCRSAPLFIILLCFPFLLFVRHQRRWRSLFIAHIKLYIQYSFVDRIPRAAIHERTTSIRSSSPILESSGALCSIVCCSILGKYVRMHGVHV